MAVLIQSTLATSPAALPQNIPSGTWYGQYQLRGSLLVIKDAQDTASGYIAFGTDMTTIPTSPTTGTGIYLDYRGIYGNASGTSQFYLQASDGKAYAGGGVVTLDVDGITLTKNSTAYIKWKSGSDVISSLVADESSGNVSVTHYGKTPSSTGSAAVALYAGQDTGYYTVFEVGAFGTSYGGGLANRRYAQMYAQNNGLNHFSINSNADNNGLSSSPSLLHLAGTAPTFQMQDTTSSAKSLLLTVDANTATFAEAAGTSVLTLGLAAGSVILGSAAVATNASDGFLWIASCAGTPTGTPTSHTGRVPLVFDTTNDKLYVYDGGWIDVT